MTEPAPPGRALTDGGLFDREVGALHLSRIYRRRITEGLIRQWARRYPDKLPRRGMDGRKVLHAGVDLQNLAREMLGDPPTGA